MSAIYKARMGDLATTDLDEGLRNLARIIRRYGETYWPLFERLEEELQDREAKAARLKRYSGRPEFERRLRSRLTD